MLSRPSKTCWKAFSDTVTIVHSARSPYVWFCDDMTVTFHCSFFTKTTFEWVLGEKDMVKASLHQAIQRHGLPRCFHIGHQHCAPYIAFLSQIKESRKECVAGRKGAHPDISLPGLLENPPQQTERMQSCAEVVLRRRDLQWAE